MVISGHKPQVVDGSQVVEMLDSLSLVDDDDRDHSSADSDSDSSDDSDSDRPPPVRHTNTPLGLSDSARKDEQALVVRGVVPSGSSLSTKTIQWNSSNRFRRGLFKSCVVDVSCTITSADEVDASPVQRQQSTGQESLSGCDSDNMATVSDTGGSCKLHEKTAAEQTTALERVKACVYEWKSAEMVAFLRTDPGAVSVRENGKEGVTDGEEVNKDNTENKIDKREETVKQYERRVGEFYGQKPRVRFVDTCKQVVNFSTTYLHLFKRILKEVKICAAKATSSYLLSPLSSSLFHSGLKKRIFSTVTSHPRLLHLQDGL